MFLLAHNICQKPWIHYSWCSLSCCEHQMLNETWLKLYTTTVIWTMTVDHRHLSQRISMHQIPKGCHLITSQRRNMDESNVFMFDHVTDNNICNIINMACVWNSMFTEWNKKNYHKNFKLQATNFQGMRNANSEKCVWCQIIKKDRVNYIPNHT